MANVDAALTTGQILTFALNASTGDIVWTQLLDVGSFPTGFVAPTPMVADNQVYFSNPTANQIVALDALNGAPLWTTVVPSAGGKYSWAPGTLVDNTDLIMPMGGNLYTLDASTGALLNTYTIGGSHTFNHVSVIGKTVYVGNSYGWIQGIPLDDITN